MKNKKKIMFLIFLFICLFGFSLNVKAENTYTLDAQGNRIYVREWNTLSPSQEKTRDYVSGWNRVDCYNATGGPFTVTYHGTPAIGYVKVTVDPFVDKEYPDEYARCKAYKTASSTTYSQFTYYFALSPSDDDVLPVVQDVSVDIFKETPIDIMGLINSKNILEIEKIEGERYTSLSLTGCSGTGTCVASITNATGGRLHKYKIKHVSVGGVYYETTLSITERDPYASTKGYAGINGFCDFDLEDWTFTVWHDDAGKRYTFFETEERDAVLPKCKNTNRSGYLVEFKGWKAGFGSGDTITTETTCSGTLLQPGDTTVFGTSYAPCYELVPHVRLVTNGGSVDTSGDWGFYNEDMSYIAKGDNVTDTVTLPDVTFSGFKLNNRLLYWQNVTTKVIKYKGDSVPLDGSVWTAVTTNTTYQIDLYKTVAWKSTELFSVTGMKGCSRTSGHTYIDVSFVNGTCQITGKNVTPDGTFANVKVLMDGEPDRIYKFSVEDRTGINQNGNGEFIIDTSSNIKVGENDENTLNGFKTNQCKEFFITLGQNESWPFAKSNSTGNEMKTHNYGVYATCESDYRTYYIGLCLDPGRRGPNERSTSTLKVDTNRNGRLDAYDSYKVGNYYNKTSDIKPGTDFGDIVSYIVKKFDIYYFRDSYHSYDIYKEQRAAAHVAVRVSAIRNGYSAVIDPSDETYASHYYPYEALAKSYDTAKLSDGNITDEEAEDIVDNIVGGQGFVDWNANVRTYLIDIFANYDGTSGVAENTNFERTIDEKNLTLIGENNEGYEINYKGTITAPTNATANMTACVNTKDEFGVECKLNEWSYVKTVDNRRVYKYDVTLTVEKGADAVPPVGDEEEKLVSFQITYSGGQDLVNVFIAEQANGSDNVQRMLVISTSNPLVYIYFSYIPNDCDLPFLDPDNCTDQPTCDAKISSNEFNPYLFKAAGCCRYMLDDSHYIVKKYCDAVCTSSTLTSACPYITDGDERADYYEIKEGALYDGTDYEDAIGTCVVNVSDDYFNDDGSAFENLYPFEEYLTKDADSNFIKYDDASNLINVSSYKNNRYCQVTCKEDWELSMDSFGNFIGKKAVAAGAFFQIVSNDMFIGGTRTCYTTFINYDRYMANLVDISNDMVDAYNDYTKWSHVWTDINEQVKKYDAAKDPSQTTITGTADTPVCAEWADTCPNYGDSWSGGLESGWYYWDTSKRGVAQNTGGCTQVPDYGNTGVIDEAVSCAATRDSQSTYHSTKQYWRSDDHEDGDMTFTNEGKNNSTTRCQFTRTYCPGNDEPYGKQKLNRTTNKCEYWDYEYRKTEDKVYIFELKNQIDKEWLDDGDRGSTSANTPDEDKVSEKVGTAVSRVTSPDESGNCPAEYDKVGVRCLSEEKYCSEGTKVGNDCYKSVCPDGYPYDNGDGTCYKYSCSGNSTYTTLIGDKCYKSCGASGTYRVNPYNSKKCQVWDCRSGYEWNADVSKCVAIDTCISSGFSAFAGTREDEWFNDYSGALYCSKEVCPTTTNTVGTKCYVKDQVGCPDGYEEYSSTDELGSTTYCRNWVDDLEPSTYLFNNIAIKYNVVDLRCKVWGKAIDYTLDNTNTFEKKIYNVYTDEEEDVYYTNHEYDVDASEGHDTRDSIADQGDSKRQSNPVKGAPVIRTYGEGYLHQCTASQGTYQPDFRYANDTTSNKIGNGSTSNVGTSSCKPVGEWMIEDGEVYTKHNNDFTTSRKMFCDKFAEVSDSNKSEAFCYVSEPSDDVNTSAVYVADQSQKKLDVAFEFLSTKMKTEAEDFTDDYRAKMQNASSSMYAHSNDMFACQNFQLHNASDDNAANRNNNPALTGKVLGATTKYTKILTLFNPYAAYEYEEDAFMTILGDDNVLVQYDEKNNAKFGGTDNAYGLTTDRQVDVTIKLPGGATEQTKLSRNYLEYAYYDPEEKWDKDSDSAKQYTDSTKLSYIPSRDGYTSSTLADTYKQITWCTVGSKRIDRRYAEGKEGAIVAFDSTVTTPEWLGGRCYQIWVAYKKAHYVQGSISNSSYYKNKGNWYIRAGDLKEHGDDLTDALNNANSRKCDDNDSFVCNNYRVTSDEKKLWSRLGSFNVFPISMSTPKNLYQYTYTFGGIGSFYDGESGRIMGNDRSIIQDNTRTCFYEVFEEVCMCCGYKMSTSTSSITPPPFPPPSDPPSDGPTDPWFSFYTNSVALGDLDLGRNNVADNWSNNQLFMYNGNDDLTTDKGANLKNNIEAYGELVYASEPEYAYKLTPDTLKEIRSYNDAVGYELNYNNLKVYSVHNIACDGTSGVGACKEGDEETINFQHFGSKFLSGEVGKNIHLNTHAYGLIKNNPTNVCTVKDTEFDPTHDIAYQMANEGCRWIDYIETSNSYKDPVTGSNDLTWFRLAFK